MTSHGTSKFWHLYRNLPGEVQLAARLAYRKFRENPAYPSLHLERLRRDPRAWSVRVNLDYRAVARREGDDWLWVWIGSHNDFIRSFRC